MKYGKFEYERTWLLPNNCLDNVTIKETKQISDHYLENTLIRLRKVDFQNSVVYKITKKEKLNPSQNGIRKINTIYLTPQEFAIFQGLSGLAIEKTRHVIEIDSIRVGIDQINLGEQVLYLAEIEFETEAQMKSFEMVLSYQREITGDHSLNGFEMAKKVNERN